MSVFLSSRFSERNIALGAPASVPELCISSLTWSPGRACGTQAASELQANLRSVFFDGR